MFGIVAKSPSLFELFHSKAIFSQDNSPNGMTEQCFRSGGVPKRAPRIPRAQLAQLRHQEEAAGRDERVEPSRSTCNYSRPLDSSSVLDRSPTYYSKNGIS